jgi:hypothetical protein
MSIRIRRQKSDEPAGIRAAVEALAPLAAMDRELLDQTLRVNLVLLANHMCKLDAAEEAAWRIVARIRTHLNSN